MKNNDFPDNLETYHKLAKDAGNKLRAYILSVSSGGTAIIFLALTKSELSSLSTLEKASLIIALISFVLTIIFSLFELRIDAKRFFSIVTELKKSKKSQDWSGNEKYKKMRFFLIHSSYFTLGFGILSISVFLIIKILIE